MIAGDARRRPCRSWRRSGRARPGRGPGSGESLLRFTLSQSAEADSNYNLDPESPGTSYFGDTRVGVDLVQETPTQRFALGLDTGLRALWEAGQDFEFTVASPTTASVGYGQEWSNAAFDAGVRYRQRQVDYLDDLSFDTIFVDGEPVFVPDNLDQLDKDTIEQRYDANLGLELATNSPSSYNFALQATQIDYTEDSEDLSPSGSLNSEALWRLRLNPVLSGALLANYYYYATEAGTESTVNIAELDAGVIYEPSEELSFNIGLGYANRQRRETIDGVRQTTEDETGPVVRGAVDYAVADDLALSANARVTTAAPETRLSGALRASYSSAARHADSPAESGLHRRQRRTGGSRHHHRNRPQSPDQLGLEPELRRLLRPAGEPGRPRGARHQPRRLLGGLLAQPHGELIFANLGYQFRWRDEDDSATSNAVFVTLGRSFETRF